MFSTPRPLPPLASAAIERYSLVGTMRLNALCGGYKLLPGAVRYFCGQPLPLWINHREDTGLQCRLDERDGWLYLHAELDTRVTEQRNIVRDIEAGRVAGFSPGSLNWSEKERGAWKDIDTLCVSEVSLIRLPTRPCFTSSVSIKEC